MKSVQPNLCGKTAAIAGLAECAGNPTGIQSTSPALTGATGGKAEMGNIEHRTPNRAGEAAAFKFTHFVFSPAALKL